MQDVSGIITSRKKNAWYFRNALVRANYNDLKNGIHETTEFLELFLRNLLLNENHPLHNRRLHVSGTFKESEKPDIETVKVDIEKNIIEPVYGHGKGKYRFKVNKG